MYFIDWIVAAEAIEGGNYLREETIRGNMVNIFKNVKDTVQLQIDFDFIVARYQWQLIRFVCYSCFGNFSLYRLNSCHGSYWRGKLFKGGNYSRKYGKYFQKWERDNATSDRFQLHCTPVSMAVDPFCVLFLFWYAHKKFFCRKS